MGILSGGLSNLVNRDSRQIRGSSVDDSVFNRKHGFSASYECAIFDWDICCQGFPDKTGKFGVLT